MKSLFGFLALFLLISLSFSRDVFAYKSLNVVDGADSMKLLEKYSLFSEYQKNKDYASAVPFGWEVLQLDPARFKKWIYYKMDRKIFRIFS